MFLSRRSNGVYYLWFEDVQGKKRKISSGCTSKSEANKFLQSFKLEEHQKKLDRITLSQFAKSFLAFSPTTHAKSTQECFKFSFKELEKSVGDVPLDKINVRDIDMFISKKRGETSDFTAKRHYLTFASAFEKARKWGHITTNPFRSVEKPKPRELQPTFFTKEEFLKLLAVIPDEDFREFCLAAVSTGLRLSELTSLEWDNVDFIRKVIFIKNSDTFTTKGRTNRVVPMNEPFYRMLKERKDKASCKYVFHSGGNMLNRFRVSKSFKQYVRGAKLNDKLHFHSLLHTFGTWLVEKGVPIYEVQMLMGHSTITVTEMYSHLDTEQLHESVGKIGFRLNN